MRTQRARLQQALLNVAPKERLHLQKRLAQIDFLPSGEVRLEFEDGYSTFVDLVVGADGIRSVRIFATSLAVDKLASRGAIRLCVEPHSRLTRSHTRGE